MSKIPINQINNFKIEKNYFGFGKCQNVLYENKNGKWVGIMVDSIAMRDERKEIIPEDVHGDVLVLGLGLGVINKYLSEIVAVNTVTTVEKSQEIIDLVWDYVDHNGKGQIVCDDAFDFIMDNQNFDYIFIDIHSDYSENSRNNVIEPLINLINDKNKVYVCWKGY